MCFCMNVFLFKIFFMVLFVIVISNVFLSLSLLSHIFFGEMVKN